MKTQIKDIKKAEAWGLLNPEGELYPVFCLLIGIIIGYINKSPNAD